MEKRTVHGPARRCGAVAQHDRSVLWRLWAPNAASVELVLIDGEKRRAAAMQKEEDGFFSHVDEEVPDGQRYAYRLDGGPERPDPCSLWQPDGVFGPSAVVRTDRFSWSDRPWRGVRQHDLVFYELHVGTFTAEGTFDAVLPRLEKLRELGVTALELMPIAQFPGTRNWGYDGVLPYAAQNSYGGPAGLQRLVNGCHAHDLAVFVDVVYNHLGPEGNFLGQFGPYFTDRYRTPWGASANFDGPGCDAVRDYVLDNARMWLDEFHADGLRIDAVHAIFDLGARPILRALKEAADEVAERRGWPAYVVAESDLNDPKLLWPPERGGYRVDAQWSDDFHHAVHTFLTGERRGYYSDFGSAAQLARVLESPFLFAGDFSRYRQRKHGAPPLDLSGDRFVVCLQNHDQIGNRARGERLNALLDTPAKQRLASSLLLLSPYLPLLFMGEEYGEESPFPFFCSFNDPQLITAVREGRRREFPEFVETGELPDPHAVTTFSSAGLSWSWPEGSARAAMRRLYRDLLAARRQWPALRDFDKRSARLLDKSEEPLLELIRGGTRPEPGQTLTAYFNLGGARRSFPDNAAHRGSLLFSSEDRRYFGEREPGTPAELLPFECVVFGPGSWLKPQADDGAR
jgi:maltooligosyltrehalose trehalohydrolase